MAYQSINPYNGQTLRTYEEHDPRQVEEMLARAHDTWRRRWSTTPVVGRCRLVGKAAALMRARKEDLARLATLEMGKRIDESRWEVELSANILQY
jgi:succinate-semialdehyde dehydrogenase/glutarate-semialdehyde dehydrogenase